MMRHTYYGQEVSGITYMSRLPEKHPTFNTEPTKAVPKKKFRPEGTELPSPFDIAASRQDPDAPTHTEGYYP